MKNLPNILSTIFVVASFLFSEKLIVKQVAQGYKKPVYLTAPKNQSDTLFIIEQIGRIQTIIHGRTTDLLLDIRERVTRERQGFLATKFSFGGERPGISQKTANKI